MPIVIQICEECGSSKLCQVFVHRVERVYLGLTSLFAAVRSMQISPSLGSTTMPACRSVGSSTSDMTPSFTILSCSSPTFD
ncbi:hypothetical protein PoB_005148900 [Plakobranchus ocellatus]|uniref:Uncharacterized protein n=1 Tax=Plakobranchus ocellatus TaxID=259542 RepID=A0AAV4C1I9_9GAST|nr:hypothetical protein PoB_005148900 [Plakobranchus ocellatus]